MRLRCSHKSLPSLPRRPRVADCSQRTGPVARRSRGGRGRDRGPRRWSAHGSRSARSGNARVCPTPSTSCSRRTSRSTSSQRRPETTRGPRTRVAVANHETAYRKVAAPRADQPDAGVPGSEVNATRLKSTRGRPVGDRLSDGATGHAPFDACRTERPVLTTPRLEHRSRGGARAADHSSLPTTARWSPRPRSEPQLTGPSARGQARRTARHPLPPAVARALWRAA